MIAQITDAASNFWKTLPDVLTRIAAALGILIVGIVIIKLGRRLLNRLFEKYRRKHEGNSRGNTVQTLTVSLFNRLCACCWAIPARTFWPARIFPSTRPCSC